MGIRYVVEREAQIEIDTFERNGEFISRVALAFDDETNATYSLLTALSPLPGLADYELIFAIIASDSSENELSAYYDGSQTRQIFPDPGMRSVIMDIICLTAVALIERGKPQKITMTTHTANLPAEALAKFHRVVQAVRESGYVGGAADVFHGQSIWMIERKP